MNSKNLHEFKKKTQIWKTTYVKKRKIEVKRSGKGKKEKKNKEGEKRGNGKKQKKRKTRKPVEKM